ncbi:MAG TPA: MtrB/PioB family decaheme-associated outer membrane protein [Woeseiaceae bacterium]|nr:MtrB/PioB family decaheme-associated outer membrane protein [Woeseiaceae bacterium]
MKPASLRTAILVVAGVVMNASTALAEAPDTSSWVCQYCPFLEGYQAEYAAGAGYVSDDAAYFGDATGHDDEGAYVDLHGNGSLTTSGQQLRWTVEDFGLDSRMLSLSGGNQGLYTYRVDYRELPRHQFDTTRTVFAQTSADGMSLPSGWVRAPTTGGFTALNANLVDRDIGSERKALNIGGRYFLFERFRLSADYRRQERDGLKIAGGSYFTQSSLLPAPFDYATDEAELALHYAARHGFLRLSYFGSFFQNRNLALRWQTPFTSAAGAEIGVQAQSPDNSFQQISVAGSYRFTGFDTVVAFNLAGGRMEQDDALLPYTGNDSLSTQPLPRQRLDGRVDTGNVALSLTSRPLDRARVSLRYRLDDRDNRTSVDGWNRVIVDTFNSGETETNVPYSFRKSSLSASGRYDILRSVTVAGGFDRVDVDRDFQEVASQTEDSGWGMLTWQPNGFIDIRAKGGASERDIDRYDTNFAGSLGQNPLLRKYNLAYRYRRFGELTLSAALPEKPVSMSVKAMYAEDEYTKSRLGITQGDDLRISGDVSFSLSENRYLYFHGGYENIESDQLGSEQFATPDWSARVTDDFRTAGGGIHLRQISDTVDVTLDYTRAVGRSEISTNSLAAGLHRFPDLESTMDSLRLQLTWRKSPRLAINAGVRYETFSVDDWALEGLMPATVPVLLSLGAQPYDYDLFLVGVGFSWRVGDTSGSTSSSDADD